MLARRLLSSSPRARQRAQDAALLLGIALGAIGLVLYAVEEKPHWMRTGMVTMTFSDALLVLGFSLVFCQVVIFFHVIGSARRQRDRGFDARCAFRVYLLTCAVTALAFSCQQLEWPRCPDWLYRSGVSVHFIWHIGIFYAAANTNALLLFAGTPGVTWSVRGGRCAAWLLPRPLPPPPAKLIPVCTADMEQVQPSV